MRLLARTAVALLAVVALTSCSKSDSTAKDATSTSASASASSSAPASPTAAPATGVEVKGTGYTYRLPQGWEDITADLKKAQPGIDSGGRATPATPPFTANLNVLTTSSDIKGKPTDAQLTALGKALKAEVAQISPDMASKPNTLLDGATALHQEGNAVSGPSKFFLVQYLAVNDGSNYSLTFAFPRSVSAGDRDKVASAVVASFRFA